MRQVHAIVPVHISGATIIGLLFTAHQLSWFFLLQHNLLTEDVVGEPAKARAIETRLRVSPLATSRLPGCEARVMTDEEEAALKGAGHANPAGLLCSCPAAPGPPLSAPHTHLLLRPAVRPSNLRVVGNMWAMSTHRHDLDSTDLTGGYRRHSILRATL